MNPQRALLSAVLAAAAPVHAAVVCFNGQDLSIPATTEGLYINFLTGVHAGTEAGAPGFDFDPYASASTAPPDDLRFYWGAAATGNAGVASSGAIYAVLPAGSVIGPSSPFTRDGFSGDTSAWTSGVTMGYLGMRFRNEAAGAIHYGWVQMTTTPPRGFPMTVHGWCFEDSGAAIAIGPVSDAIFGNGFDG